MGNIAKNVDEQIDLLQSRGMIINDIEKAKEVLLDVGYYRLGFYWFPYEVDYPQKHHRTHEFTKGADFDNAVKLYYFDFNLRNILLKALSRIEIAFRTKVIYFVSNKYKNSPTWFVDTNVVSNSQARSFWEKVYKQILDKTPVIALHHRHHINDKFAPALRVVIYMLSQVSENRSKELMNEIDALIQKHKQFVQVSRILDEISGLSQFHRK